MAKVTMPQLGESVAEGTIGKWLKQPGDTVEKYEPLVEVITDKVNAEVPSPFAGILKEILVEEGATVPNNAEIAVIETAEEGAGATDSPASAGAEPTTSSAPKSEAAQAPAPTSDAAPDDKDAAPDDKGAPAPAPAPEPAAPKPAALEPAAAELAPVVHGPAGSDERPERAAAIAAPAAPTAVDEELPGNADARMTPAVRRLLREHGLTAAQIVGSGGGGRITREDVTNYVETQRIGQSVGGQALADGTSPAAATSPAPRAPAGPAAPSAPPASSAASADALTTNGTKLRPMPSLV